MSETPDETTEEFGLERRTFLKASGAAAGAGLLGTAATGSAAAHDGFHSEFANWRVREAKKVWDRGYRGRPDRAIGLTDSGIDARHPDLGPWNGVQAVPGENGLQLTGPGAYDEGESRPERVRVNDGADGPDIEASGTAGPGTFAEGSEFEIVQFGSGTDTAIPSEAQELDATLSWTPFAQNGNDLELRLDVRKNGEWQPVTTAATASEPERILGQDVDPSKKYRFVGEQYKNVSCDYTLTANFFEFTGELQTFDASKLFAKDGTPQQLLPGGADGSLPKTIGWFNEVARYGSYKEPRDTNGHGSHCASIMGGSGRGSAVETVTEEEPRAVLIAGDTLDYQVEAEAGTGVFIAAYGEGIEAIIEGPDGERLDISTEPATEDATPDDGGEIDRYIVAEAPADETGTYTCYIRAAKGEFASTGRARKVAVGQFADPTATTGDRAAGGDVSLHTGMAPNASLVGLQGLSAPTVSLGEYAEDFSSIFNLRTVNMSWGYVGGLPLGGLGQFADVVGAIKQAAQAGILSVAAAGNAATPANGNGAPAVADEAVSVTSTGPLDGLVSYSSGGLGGNDEDGEGQYMKPDVSAPGGSLSDLINAAKIGPVEDSDGDGYDDSGNEFGDIRDYTGKAGTSMASPYTNGTAGLVAEAMEFGAPDSIALPEPAETAFEDVMRLKSVLLSTASETAFTAAPYHRAHVPTYEFGGRDPYEGYGRVNPDAAVDAVTRELVDASDLGGGKSRSATFEETLGLNLPEDSRAVAGYVQTAAGTLEASVEFSHYSGGNKGMTKGDPHIDLFVYDAESPADNGEPNIVTRAQARRGSTDLSVDIDAGTYYVVAKLVNVPGVVNGYDVQTHFDLGVDVSVDAVETEFTATGERSTGASVYTGGQTKRVEVTISDFSNATEVEVFDRFPGDWDVLEAFSDDVADVDEQNNVVEFVGTVSESDLGTEKAKRTYFVEAPSGPTATDSYTFGPAYATVVPGKEDVPGKDTDGNLDGDEQDDVGGSSSARVVGPST